MGEEEKKNLKVDDLKKMICSRHEEEEEKHILDEYRELQAENEHLRNIVEIYRDSRESFRRFSNKALVLTLAGFLIFQGKNMMEKYKEYKTTKKIIANEKQLDEEIRNFNLVDILGANIKQPQNIKLGTVLEDYVGFDLDDKKVELLDRESCVSVIKYELDSGNPDIVIDDFYKCCVYFMSNRILDIIYIDNPELENYILNIQDGYLYADGEYQMNGELFYSYCLGRDAYQYSYGDEFEMTADELNFVIDTCLKATCYDVLLDHEEKRLDFSLSRIAKEYDYQLPPVNNIKNDRCEAPKVKVKSNTTEG